MAYAMANKNKLYCRGTQIYTKEIVLITNEYRNEDTMMQKYTS